MTPDQIDKVRQSWSRVYPIRTTAADLFYRKLFEIDPALRRLFHCDMFAQGDKLMTALNGAVCSLDQMDELLPVAAELGKRHVSYGASADHYRTVAAALLWTLEQALGDAFTPQVRDAWTTLYEILAKAMHPS